MKHNTQKLLNNAVFEVLEDRRLMSAAALPTAWLSNGTLTITDTNPASARVTIDQTRDGSQLMVDVQGQRSSFNANAVRRFTITTGKGADYVYINPAIDIPANIVSGNGNDTLRSGAGADTIITGNGNDLIYAKGGNNIIQTGNGNDSIYGGAGDDSFNVGNGNDLLVGGGGSDRMTAGSGNDTFVAGDSHDTVTTGTGHDVLIGGLGNTYLYGKNPSASTASVTGGSTAIPTNIGSRPGAGTTSPNSSASQTSLTASTKPTGSSLPMGPTVPSKPIAPARQPTQPAQAVPPIAPIVPVVQTKPVVSTLPPPTYSAQAPVARINTLTGPRVAGMVVNVDGLSSTLHVGTAITTNYAWDFGDLGTSYDQMTGYNAGHVYDQPGSYTIRLSITDSAGQISTATQQVNISASARTQIYVDPSRGSDSNSGTLNSPLRSLPAAFNMLGNNTEILLRAGQTFATDTTMHINFSNVLIGRYGAGANPTVMRSYGNGVSTIASYSGTNGLTIQDITFDSPYSSTNPNAPKIGVSGIYLGGQNCTVRDCTFLNLDDAINENGCPVGTLIQNNTAPLSIGLRGYMIWGQGTQQVIIGNTAAGTTQEHNLRLVDVNEVTVEGNNFTNHDGKGCIEMHRGSYAWIQGNSVTGGDIRLGPLGLWGESASSCTDWCVIEDNQLTNTFVYINAGTHHAMVSNNVINNTAGPAITLSGTDNQGRTSADITISHNTATDSGTRGSFITVWGWVNGIVMKNNLWIAPQLEVGTYSSTPVYVNASNLNSFTLISENIWPAPDTAGTYANGGINFVGASSTSTAYLTIAQWDQMSNVKGDIFKSVTLNDSYEMKIESVIAGAALRMAA